MFLLRKYVLHINFFKDTVVDDDDYDDDSVVCWEKGKNEKN